LGQVEDKGGVAGLGVLGPAQLDVLGKGAGELPQEPTPAGEKGQFHPVGEAELEGRSGEVHPAEDQDGLQFGHGDVRQGLIVLGHQEALPLPLQDRALFGEVEEGHVLPSGGRLAGGQVGRQVKGRGHVKDPFFSFRAVKGGEDGTFEEKQTQEFEAFVKIGNDRVLGVQGQVEAGEDPLSELQGGLGLGTGLSENNEVIGVAHQVKALGGKGLIQLIQKKVGQQQ
jgi:hypothetical protein